MFEGYKINLKFKKDGSDVLVEGITASTKTLFTIRHVVLKLPELETEEIYSLWDNNGKERIHVSELGKGTLADWICNNFPTTKYVQITDPDPNMWKISLSDGKNNLHSLSVCQIAPSNSNPLNMASI